MHPVSLVAGRLRKLPFVRGWGPTSFELIDTFAGTGAEKPRQTLVGLVGLLGLDGTSDSPPKTGCQTLGTNWPSLVGTRGARHPNLWSGLRYQKPNSLCFAVAARVASEGPVYSVPVRPPVYSVPVRPPI